MACEACTDRTFRLRVTCTPCAGTDCPGACSNLPRTICLRFTGANTGHAEIDSLLNGKTVTLTLDSELTGDTSYPIYRGTFILIYGYYQFVYDVLFKCINGVLYGSGIDAWSGSLTASCNQTGTLGSVGNVGGPCMLAYPDIVYACAGLRARPFPSVPISCELVTTPPTYTCEPFTLTGTFKFVEWNPAEGSYSLTGGSVGFTAAPGISGCDELTPCCESELGAHPNLNVTVVAPNAPSCLAGLYCYSFLGSGTYTAVWNAGISAWTFNPNPLWSPCGTYGSYKLYCPGGPFMPGGNTWALEELISTPARNIFYGIGGCNPFYAYFAIPLHGNDPSCVGFVTVTL